MTIIAGDQIRSAVTRKRATQIIDKMVGLLEARRTLRVSRRQFLVQWGKLRKALFLTRDYQELRDRIHVRCGGICELCHKLAASHVHHKVPVAYAPRRALDDKNCQGVCVGCHDEAHANGTA